MKKSYYRKSHNRIAIQYKGSPRPPTTKVIDRLVKEWLDMDQNIVLNAAHLSLIASKYGDTVLMERNAKTKKWAITGFAWVESLCKSNTL